MYPTVFKKTDRFVLKTTERKKTFVKKKIVVKKIVIRLLKVQIE